MFVRAQLRSSADWVVAADMPVASEYPRSPQPSLAREQGKKEQRTRACVVGLLALALSHQVLSSKTAEGRPNVLSIRDVVLKMTNDNPELNARKRATLNIYITEGPAAVEGEEQR